jgi:hypothetical protein
MLASRPARRRVQQRAQPEQAGPAGPRRARRLPGRRAPGRRPWQRPASCSSRPVLCGRRARARRVCARRRRRRRGRAGIGRRRGGRPRRSELDGGAKGRASRRPPLCFLHSAGQGAGVNARETRQVAACAPGPPGRRSHSKTGAEAEPWVCSATGTSIRSRPSPMPASRPSMQHASKVQQGYLWASLVSSACTTIASKPYPTPTQRPAKQGRPLGRRCLTASGTSGARQIGQVLCWLSQASMHFRWKSCPQRGSRRSSSPASYSPRHTLHASSPPRPDALPRGRRSLAQHRQRRCMHQQGAALLHCSSQAQRMQRMHCKPCQLAQRYRRSHA